MIRQRRKNAKGRSPRLELFCASLLVLLATISPADRVFAHEVWIEPSKAHLAEGEGLVADLRIGDMFRGDHLIYIPQQTERLSVLTDAGSFDLEPRVGSRPVISVPPEKLQGSTGTVVVVYQSANSYVHYRSQEKFFTFARKKGTGDLQQRHETRQLPDSGFVERYKRFAKAVIPVGPDSGSVNDVAVGMELEFVTRSRNLLPDAGHEYEFQLFYQGKLLPKAQVTLFSRDGDGLVKSIQTLTDAKGSVRVTTKAGHRYLLDHVTLREADPSRDRNRPVWESLWASLTFAGPKS